MRQRLRRSSTPDPPACHRRRPKAARKRACESQSPHPPRACASSSSSCRRRGSNRRCGLVAQSPGCHSCAAWFAAQDQATALQADGAALQRERERADAAEEELRELSQRVRGAVAPAVRPPSLDTSRFCEQLKSPSELERELAARDQELASVRAEMITEVRARGRRLESPAWRALTPAPPPPNAGAGAALAAAGRAGGQHRQG